MIKKNKELLVGVVTIIGISILIVSVLWGKNIQRDIEYEKIIFRFNTINSLDTGDQIYIRGVLAGKVTDIILLDNDVEVRAILKKGLSLYSDASALIVNKELMGGRMIILKTGKSGKLLDLTKPIKGINNKGLTEALAESVNMIGDFKRITSKVDTLITGLNRIIPKKNLGKTIDDFTNQFQADTKDLTNCVKSSLNGLNTTLNEFNRTAKEAQIGIKELRHLTPNIKKILLRFDNLMITTKEKLVLLSDF